MAISVDEFLSPTALAKIFPITYEDIESVSHPMGWLTDVVVRTIILKERSPAHCEYIRFVDPTFLERWENDLETGVQQASKAGIPTFLLPPQDSVEPVSELVIPFNVGNFHWTTIHVDLRRRKATFYDSIANSRVAKRIEVLMQCFFAEYHQHMPRGSEDGFVFEDANTAQQNDDSSCGLYTIYNCLALLEGHHPDSTAFNYETLYGFRQACASVMRREKANQEAENGDIHPSGNGEKDNVL